MRLYCGIDLHSNNAYLVVIDEKDQTLYAARLPHELQAILSALAPYTDRLAGVVVEATYNWYWLADGLIRAGYRVHLANPGAMVRYRGLKHANDRSDARWLAHLLRLGVLPEGYICPPEQRALRDLLRKRGSLVQQRTANLLSLKNLYQRSTGQRLSVGQLDKLDLERIDQQLTNKNVAQAASSTLRILGCLSEEVQLLEKEVLRQLKPDPMLKLVLTVPGVGRVLAPTILLETGEISRFPSAGNYVSYSRVVNSEHQSNGKTKGHGNTKNGNPYLSWAYSEAAVFAKRHYLPIRRFCERKQAKTHPVVALRAAAHKLARATYYVMRDQVPFEIDKAFG